MAMVWAWASSVEAYAACGKSVVVPRAVCGSCQDALNCQTEAARRRPRTSTQRTALWSAQNVTLELSNSCRPPPARVVRLAGSLHLAYR